MRNMVRLAAMAMVVMVSGCSVTMTPPGQNAAALMQPPVETRVETKVVPVVERRSAIRSTGYAVISVQPSDVDAQQRLLAIRASKLDAYRGLTEQVYGQYLDATTTVADMAVLSDTFRTQVEGVIYGAKVVSIAPAQIAANIMKTIDGMPGMIPRRVKMPAVMNSAPGFANCPVVWSVIDSLVVTRVTTIAVARDSTKEGICATRPSPMVKST